MHYSLQERFIGAFLGGMIGEQLSLSNNDQRHYYFLKQNKEQQISKLQSDQKIIVKLLSSKGQSLSWKDLERIIMEPMTSSKIITTILPIILYYHDDLSQLELFLYQAVQNQQLSSSSAHIIFWWISVIVLALRETLTIENFWNQLSMISKIFTIPIPNNLSNLQILFEQGLSITEVTKKLSLIVTKDMLPFLLSLYCFYQTPENFTLTIKQANLLKNQVSDILALTGNISGAYNSKQGVNRSWEQFYCNEGDYIESNKLGKRLFTLWSGLYITENHINTSAIIATPRTLQNRSHLTIISQKEYEAK